MATNKLATQRRQVSNYLTTLKQLLAVYDVKMTATGAGQMDNCARTTLAFRRWRLLYSSQVQFFRQKVELFTPQLLTTF